jgi:hypothetical protein
VSIDYWDISTEVDMRINLALRTLTSICAALAAILATSKATHTQRGGRDIVRDPAAPAAVADSAGIVRFAIHVPDSILKDLKRRLEQARFADEPADANWDYGTNLA